MTNLLLLAAGAQAAEPRLLGGNAEDWVYVGLTFFFLIAIFIVKAPAKLTAALDAQIAEARKTLDEAAAIRAEAEALLESAKRRFAASTEEAAAVLHHARVECETLIAKAEVEASEVIVRREKMANAKIATAERAAIDHLRARAAQAAIGTAKDLIVAQHDAIADARLVKDAIAAF